MRINVFHELFRDQRYKYLQVWLPGVFLVVACSQSESESLSFVESSQLSGLTFQHTSSSPTGPGLQETWGSGVALIDYDIDGDLDVYFVQGHGRSHGRAVSSSTKEASSETTTGKGADGPGDAYYPFNAQLVSLGDRLFRNDSSLTQVKFTDVTSSVGIGHDALDDGVGMGVAVEDLNDDRLPDLVVTTTKRNKILLNQKGGRFIHIDRDEQGSQSNWSTAVAIADFNGDSKKDLYIGNFAHKDIVDECYSQEEHQNNCLPDQPPLLSDQLLVNKGSNSSGIPIFEDQSDRFGLRKITAATASVIAADFNRDGHVDIHIANSAGSDLMLINQQGRRFVDTALIASVDQGLFSESKFSTSADAADIDGDGDLDLLVAYADAQIVRILSNKGNGRFLDKTDSSGLRRYILPGGVKSPLLVDLNVDGLIDIFVASGGMGHLQRPAEYPAQNPFAAAHQFFLGQTHSVTSGITRHSDMEWTEVIPLNDWVEFERFASRGAAVGDIDNDGDADLVINNNNGAAELLINLSNPARWLGVDARNDAGAAIGASVFLMTDANSGFSSSVNSSKSTTFGGSWTGIQLRNRGFASASDYRVRFPIVSASNKAQIVIEWPDLSKERFIISPLNQYHIVTQGQGLPLSQAAHVKISHSNE